MAVMQLDAGSDLDCGDRSRRARLLGVGLAVLLVLVAGLSLGTGAAGVGFDSLLAALSGAPLDDRSRIVLFELRLPRLLMGMLVGASLAVSGAVMQGLFRNPLADPGVVGVSAGASLGAISAIVLGAALPIGLGAHLVPVAAFIGAVSVTLVLYRIATAQGTTSVAMLLLGGIALAALFSAASGVLIYLADDRQLRDLTFWSMGSLGGASWAKLTVAGPLMLVALAGAIALSRGLNGLALGEAVAGHLGVPVERIKTLAVLVVAGATGAAVAVSGGIAFVGIIVPHLLRLASGPDHRPLLPNAAIAGALILTLADLVARNVIAPAELPIGIVTALCGGPVFLWILLRQRGTLGL